MQVSTSEALLNEFMQQKYMANFNIASGSIMETFLSMEVRKTKPGIDLHLDHYIQETLAGYNAFIKKTLRPKKVPTSSGVILSTVPCPEVADPRKQNFCQSCVAKLWFAWIHLLDSVLLSVHLNGQPCITSWNTLRAPPAWDYVPPPTTIRRPAEQFCRPRLR